MALSASHTNIARAAWINRQVEWLFDLFNFNSKGYLIHSDMSLLILSVASGICKADKNIQVPSTRQQQLILEESFKFSKVNPGHSLRKPELVKFAAGYREVQLYLDAWRGHGGQVLLAGGEKWRDQVRPRKHIDAHHSSSPRSFARFLRSSSSWRTSWPSLHPGTG